MTHVRFSGDGSTLHFTAPALTYPRAAYALRIGEGPRAACAVPARGEPAATLGTILLPTGTATVVPSPDGRADLAWAGDTITLHTPHLRGARGVARARGVNAKAAMPAWVTAREAIFHGEGGWRVLDVDGLERPFVLEPAAPAGTSGGAFAFLGGAIRVESKSPVSLSRDAGAGESGIATDATISVATADGRELRLSVARVEWTHAGGRLALRAIGAAFTEPPGTLSLYFPVGFSRVELEAAEGKAAIRLSGRTTERASAAARIAEIDVRLEVDLRGAKGEER